MDKTLHAAIDSVKLNCDRVNNSDPGLISRTLHFPHYRIQIDGSVLVWNSESEYLASFSERTSDAGWSYSEIDAIEDNTISEHKCHVKTSFSKYRNNGSLIEKVAAFYIVIFKDSRWGMNAGSVLTSS